MEFRDEKICKVLKEFLIKKKKNGAETPTTIAIIANKIM